MKSYKVPECAFDRPESSVKIEYVPMEKYHSLFEMERVKQGMKHKRENNEGLGNIGGCTLLYLFWFLFAALIGILGVLDTIF